MRIKQTSTKNEYLKSGEVLIRNFTKSNIVPIGLSHMFRKEDYDTVLANEENNKKKPKISNEKLHFEKVLIVSDGYDFKEHQSVVDEMPLDVCILVVNGALKKWKSKRKINAFVANNPYRDALDHLPKSYFPVCIASSRTNKDFINKYKGDVYTYLPTPERFFGYGSHADYFIDDYRNPICACIGLAYQFGVEKLMMLYCDDSFEKERDSAVRLSNGLWTYPHHLRSQDIIDANLHWLSHQEGREVKIVDCSRGREYTNAPYISSEEAIGFFANQQEDNN